jgi:hypothetical protein
LKSVRKRKLIDEMRGEWNVSIRRACDVFQLDTSTYHYFPGACKAQEPMSVQKLSAESTIEGFDKSIVVEELWLV